jgi:Tol biopolymer transport system component/tRNA A-37 threonylcarbamoyl transferase component Bud32
MIGETISHYRIESKIGEGGMAVVYKAEDTKLRRTVALKFLSPHAGENRERFLREAQAVAALNHPNICTIHEIDEERGFIAMEWIDGPSVRDKIAARPLPLEEALDIAMQTCQGLLAAHEKGVVHRDIKPANLMLTTQGQVKIMDFGLAQLGERTRITRTGMSLGTPAYMSPEQAKGEPTDRRTDLWSLGVVLYEMLAGKTPFPGQTEQAVSYGIVHSEPEPLTALRTGLPPQVDRIVAKALAKGPDSRYQHVAELRVDLAALANRRGAAGPSAPPAPSRPWLSALGGAAGALAVMVAALAVPSVRERIAPAAASLPAEARLTQLTTYSGTERSGAISPDGRHIAFVSEKGGQPDIWARQISGGEAVQLTNNAAAESGLVYSRDGESVYYNSQGSIWRVSALGGVPRKIVDGGRGPSLSADGNRMAYLRGAAIEIAGSDGAGARKVGEVPGLSSVMRLSPDGRWIAFNEARLMEVGQLFVASVDGGPPKQITRFKEGYIGNGGLVFDWTPDSRHVIFSRANDPNVIANYTDLWVLPVGGGAARRLTLNKWGRFQDLSSSADGRRLVATMQSTEREVWKAPLGSDPVANGKAAVRLVDNSGNPMWIHRAAARPLLLFNAVFAGPRNLWTLALDSSAPPRQLTQFQSSSVTHAALSPDGSRIAYASMETGNSEIWTMNADGSNPFQVTHDPAADYWPAWTADGKWLAFGSARTSPQQLWKVPSTGGTAVQLTKEGGTRGDWSPADDRIVYSAESPGGGALKVAAFDGNVLLRIPYADAAGALPVWSPDGRRFSAIHREGRELDSVWIFDALTGEGRKAVQFPAGFGLIFRAVWTPDGASIIVNRSENTSHIVLLENFW